MNDHARSLLVIDGDGARAAAVVTAAAGLGDTFVAHLPGIDEALRSDTRPDVLLVSDDEVARARGMLHQLTKRPDGPPAVLAVLCQAEAPRAAAEFDADLVLGWPAPDREVRRVIDMAAELAWCRSALSLGGRDLALAVAEWEARHEERRRAVVASDPSPTDQVRNVPCAGDASSILVVDDDRALAEMIELGLRLEFPTLRVARAESSADALDHCVRGGVDLLITDLQMPGMSGGDVIAHVRARLETPPVAVLMSGSAELQETARACGAEFALTKPFAWERLYESVRRGLELARRQRAGSAGG